MKAATERGLRLFTGLSLTPEVREHVSSIVSELSERVEGVRWIPEENFHVTLKFIGPCPEERVPCVVDAMRRASRHLPLYLEIGGVGTFPSLGSARVVWVGACDLEGRIEKIYNVIDRGAEKCGIPRERRRYKPHVTVGRCRKKPATVPRELAERFCGRVELEVADIVLYSSELNSTGARYSIVETVSL